MMGLQGFSISDQCLRLALLFVQKIVTLVLFKLDLRSDQLIIRYMYLRAIYKLASLDVWGRRPPEIRHLRIHFIML